jgi:hypothetical protein
MGRSDVVAWLREHPEEIGALLAEAKAAAGWEPVAPADTGCWVRDALAPYGDAVATVEFFDADGWQWDAVGRTGWCASKADAMEAADAALLMAGWTLVGGAR